MQRLSLGTMILYTASPSFPQHHDQSLQVYNLCAHGQEHNGTCIHAVVLRALELNINSLL